MINTKANSSKKNFCYIVLGTSAFISLNNYAQEATSNKSLKSSLKSYAPKRPDLEYKNNAHL